MLIQTVLQAVAACACKSLQAFTKHGVSMELVAGYKPPYYLGEDQQCWETDDATYCLWPCHCLFLHSAVQEVMMPA